MLIVQAHPRCSGEKAHNIRKAGMVPGCLYGGNLEQSIALQLPLTEVRKLLKNKAEGGRVRLDVSGEQMDVLVKEISTFSVSGQIQHLSFLKLEADKAVNGRAQVVLENRDKIPSFISQLIFEIPYRTTGTALTETVTVDLEGMHPGDSVRVKDLPIANCPDTQLLIDEDSVILTIVGNKRA